MHEFEPFRPFFSSLFLSGLTEGFSGSDLTTLAKEASSRKLRKFVKKNGRDVHADSASFHQFFINTLLTLKSIYRFHLQVLFTSKRHWKMWNLLLNLRQFSCSTSGISNLDLVPQNLMTIVMMMTMIKSFVPHQIELISKYRLRLLRKSVKISF